MNYLVIFIVTIIPSAYIIATRADEPKAIGMSVLTILLGIGLAYVQNKGLNDKVKDIF